MAAAPIKSIIFNTSKKEHGNPASNMKKVAQKYKGSNYKIGLNKQTVDFERIKGASVFVLACPKQKFSTDQIASLKKYVQNGGSLLIFTSEGGDRKNGTNLNDVLKGFGVSINNDSVMRTSYYKYLHPKQAYIHNGILNEQIVRVINGYAKEPQSKNSSFLMGGGSSTNDDEQERESKRTGCDFVYVNGATLKTSSSSNAILSSGPLTYPSNKPICTVSQKKGSGKLLVFGSIDSMMDDYFDLEENNKIFDFMLKFLLTDEVNFDFGKDDTDKASSTVVPDIAGLADGIKSCFQQSEDVPVDYTTLFQQTLFKYDTNVIPQAIKLYETLAVKHQPLSLIVPQFQTPLLGLAPAVFPPILKQISSPSLEQFDLDDQFALQKVRMSQLTNKCQNKDLEYFVREAGDMLGVSDKVKNRAQAKSILKYILEEIINYKKVDPNY